ncbi:hypothetical protein WS95_04215 [Burkholderia sp. MSMB1826]|nr:hypothetical protein WS95_04215 [Burkholderia sp. MSMB1826]
MSIGAEPEVDILITDWSEGTMQLVANSEDTLMIGMRNDPSSAIVMEDFVPQRFGDVVICAGPFDASWPSDFQLMERMFSPHVERRKYDGEEADGIAPAGPPPLYALNRERRSPWARAGIAALLVGSMGAAAMALPTGKNSQTTTQPQTRPTISDVRQVIAQMHETDLTVTQQPDGFVVTGIVSNTANARTLHAALRALAVNRLDWSVRTGDEIANALAESLHEPNVQVRYVGQRRLEVSGAARRPASVRDVVDRFRSDIGPLVSNINVSVDRTDDLIVAGNVDSALSSDTVKYVETSDGTKNFLSDIPSRDLIH